MLKSTKLVSGLGLLLGVAVLSLPTSSFAAVTIASTPVQVSATVAGVVGFSATDHTFETGTSYGLNYDDNNHQYVGTFRPGDTTNNFGTTTYQVLCNYRTASYTGQVYDDPDGDGVYNHPATGTVNGVANTPITGANSDCSQGWHVSATTPAAYVVNGAAVMKTNTTPAYTIPSATPSDASTIAGSTANWAMKVTGVSKTIGSDTYAPTPTPASAQDTSYAAFHAVPTSATTVVSGNTFRSMNSVANSYFGTESFQVTYGFNAGMAVAGTYTGQVEYTLYIGN